MIDTEETLMTKRQQILQILQIHELNLPTRAIIKDHTHTQIGMNFSFKHFIVFNLELQTVQ